MIRSLRTLTVCLLTALSLTNGTSQTPVLVKDINATPRAGPSSRPEAFIQFGGDVYFGAITAATGGELFRSRGPGAATTLVADLVPGSVGSAPRNLLSLGSRFIFTAYDANKTPLLYGSDGTAAGTVRLGSLQRPKDFVRLGNIAFFQGEDGMGTELWATDGTGGGTRRVKDIAPGTAGSNPMPLGVFNNRVFLRADDAASGAELWVTDGTAGGTQRVKDIVTGLPGSSPRGFAVLGSVFYFLKTEGSPLDLYRSDGTAAGTTKIATVANSSTNAGPIVAWNGRIYFPAADTNGPTLWESDGTAAGTKRVLNTPLWPGWLTSTPAGLFFGGYSPTTGRELYVVDTTGAARLIEDLTPGAPSSDPEQLVRFNGKLFYGVKRGTGFALWGSDGTRAGTSAVSSFPTSAGGIDQLTVVGNRMWMGADDGVTGTEPWISDGTTAGTRSVVDLNPGTQPGTLRSEPRKLNDFYGTLLFTADDGKTGRELWKSDGTSGGTRLLKDILGGPQSSDPGQFVIAGDRMFFVANRTELWVTNGTANGTRQVRAFAWNPSLTRLAAIGRNLVFVATDAATGAELWRSDGTAAGTTRFKDIRPGPSGSMPSNLTSLGRFVFFSADDGSAGRELWVTDGTPAGTRLVADVFPGPGASVPQTIAAFDGHVYFFADDGRAGSELWRSDGTPVGTVLVTDLIPGQPGSYGQRWIVGSRNTLFVVFANNIAGTHQIWAGNGAPGAMRQVGAVSIPLTGARAAAGKLYVATSLGDLYVSDGTTAGTRLVRKLDGYGTGGPTTSLVASGDRFAWLRANDGVSGSEVWRTDGTSAGTRLVADLVPGAAHSAPLALTMSAGRLFFSADDGRAGRELWMIDVGAGARRVGRGCGAGLTAPTLDVTDPVLGSRMTLSLTNLTSGATLALLWSPHFVRGYGIGRGCFGAIAPYDFGILVHQRVFTPSWTTTVRVPNVNALIGVPITVQGFTGPTASSLGFDLTNGVHCRLGR